MPGTGTATPADETALLTRGPDIMALGEYFTAMDGVIGDLERMWKGFTAGRGGAREAGVRDLVRAFADFGAEVLLKPKSKLVEVGFGGLVALFLKLSNEGVNKPFDPEHFLEAGKGLQCFTADA